MPTGRLFDRRRGLVISLILLDVQTFLQWGQAVQTEALVAEADGVERSDPTIFDPANPTLSGYFFSLFREDFRPRVAAWIEGGGVNNPAGPNPFFPLQDYIDESVAPAAEATRLAEIADEKSTLARRDNQNSDDYVITVVILATVLFFAGVSNKMKSRGNQTLMVFLTLAMMTWGILRLATLPIHAIP